MRGISNKKIDLPMQGFKACALSIGMRGNGSGCVNGRVRVNAELWGMLTGEGWYTLDHY